MQNKQVCSSSGKRKSHLVMGIDFREIFFYIDNFHEHLLFFITDSTLAPVNGLPTSHQEIPVSFIPEEGEFQFRAATSFEINRIVQSFPSNKAPGKDKLQMAVVKDDLPAILPILTEIVNSSLLTSVFPSP